MIESKDSGNWIEISDPSQLPKQPVVSVLMCTYNHGPYLADAIHGVLIQETDFPIELMIGEDCSSDNTRKIAVQLQGQYPHLIRIVAWERNVGAHVNVKKIFESSRGEFVAFCDGDDYWTDPTKLQRQVDVFRTRSDVSAVFTNFALSGFSDGRWSINTTRALSDNEVDGLRGNLRGKAPCGSLRTLTLIYRSKVLRHLHARNLPMDEYPFSDGFMVAEAIAAGNIECLDQVCAVYRQSPNSVTRSNVSSVFRVLRAVRDFYEQHDKFFPEIAPIDPTVLRRSNIDVCRVAYATGNFEVYLDSYRRLQKLDLPIPGYLSFLRWGMMIPGFRRLSLELRSLVLASARLLRLGHRQVH